MEKGGVAYPESGIKDCGQKLGPEAYWQQAELQISNHVAERTNEAVISIRSNDLERVYPGMDYLDEHHDKSQKADTDRPR
jgi:hypothetical protein